MICDAQLTTDKVRQIQMALKDKGFDPGPKESSRAGRRRGADLVSVGLLAGRTGRADRDENPEKAAERPDAKPSNDAFVWVRAALPATIQCDRELTGEDPVEGVWATMKTRRRTLQRASASLVLAVALGFSAAAATKPPAATSATSDEATTFLLGDWLGILDTGADAAKLRLVLHVGKNPDGTLNASLDSLDENVKGILANKPNFAGGLLGLNLPTIGVHCELALAPNQVELKGTWYKVETSFPVEFKKQAAPSSRGR